MLLRRPLPRPILDFPRTLCRCPPQRAFFPRRPKTHSVDIRKIKIYNNYSRKQLVFLVSGAIAANVFLAWKFWLPIEQKLAQATKNIPEELIKGAMEKAEPTFIPFPGTTRLLERKEMDADDPQMKLIQAYVSDAEGRRQDFVDMCHLVRDEILQRTNLTDFWFTFNSLGISAPRYKADKYQRSGIEWGSDYIAWATRSVEPEVVWQQRSIYDPRYILVRICEALSRDILQDISTMNRGMRTWQDDDALSLDPTQNEPAASANIEAANERHSEHMSIGNNSDDKPLKRNYTLTWTVDDGHSTEEPDQYHSLFRKLNSLQAWLPQSWNVWAEDEWERGLMGEHKAIILHGNIKFKAVADAKPALYSAKIGVWLNLETRSFVEDSLRIVITDKRPLRQ